MTVTELIVVRHGESMGNLAADEARDRDAEVVDIDLRDADVPLSELGRDQAAALGEWLTTQPVGAVVCSPYLRARQTASVALGAAHLDPPQRLDERLRDRELGVLDRLTANGIRSRFPQEAERRRFLGKFFYRPPGGESWADVALRVRSLLADLDRTVRSGPLLLVAHDAVIFATHYVLQALTEQQILEVAAHDSVANCSVTTYHRVGSSWRLGVFADRSHLENAGVRPTTHPGERDDVHLT